MLTDKKMKIVIENNNEHIFVDKLACIDCRAFTTCKPTDTCKLYNYLHQRISDTSLDADNVITIKAKDYDKTITLIKRAIKLRKHRIR